MNEAIGHIKLYILNLFESFHSFPNQAYTQNNKIGLWVFNDSESFIEVSLDKGNHANISVYLISSFDEILLKEDTFRQFISLEPAVEYIKYLNRIRKVYSLRCFHLFEKRLDNRFDKIYNSYSMNLLNSREFNNDLIVHCRLHGFTKEFTEEFYFKYETRKFKVFYSKTANKDIYWGKLEGDSQKTFENIEDFLGFLYSTSQAGGHAIK